MCESKAVSEPANGGILGHSVFGGIISTPPDSQNPIPLRTWATMSRETRVKEAKSKPRPVELRPDLYRAVFESSSEPIVILDPQGFYVEQNAAHEALLGYSDEDLKHQTPAIHTGGQTFADAVAELEANG